MDGGTGGTYLRFTIYDLEIMRAVGAGYADRGLRGIFETMRDDT